jgi:hypothetical protein
VLNGPHIVEYRGDKPMLVVDTPAQVTLLPVTDSGVTYPVPTEHLGQRLSSSHPVVVAEAGLKFYEQFVAALTARFFPGDRAV